LQASIVLSRWIIVSETLDRES